jgi:hypothetical protein
MVCLVAYRGSCVGRNGDIDHDLTEESATFVENLNGMVSADRYIDIVLSIDCDAMWGVELTLLAPWLSP